MSLKTPGFYLVALALAGFHSPSYAAMRCGTALVSEGSSTYEVEQACGTPAHREVLPAVQHQRRAKHSHAAAIERWLYGPRNGATYELKFIDGTLVDIKSSR